MSAGYQELLSLCMMEYLWILTGANTSCSARSPAPVKAQRQPFEQRDPWNFILRSAYFTVSMYQQFSATAPPDYEHNSLMGSLSAGPSTVAPHATTTTPTSHQKPPPLVATGDWAHELVQLAKTAELK